MGLEPDYVINNAGIFSFKEVTATGAATVSCFINLHVRAVTELSKAFASRFAARRHGRILNMSSMSCWMPMPGIALYSATKAYIRVFSRALHYELRDSGVSVTVACPGGIATDLFGLPENLKKLAINLGVLARPETLSQSKSTRCSKAENSISTVYSTASPLFCLRHAYHGAHGGKTPYTRPHEMNESEYVKLPSGDLLLSPAPRAK